TQRDLLTSRSLAAQVIRDLGLDEGSRFRKYMEAPPSWVQSYLSFDPVVSRVRSLVAWLLERYKALGGESQGLEEPGTEPPNGFEFGVHPSLIDLYLSRLVISYVSPTQIVSVHFTSLNPAFSQEVANAHATTFIRTSLLTRFELT